MEKLTVINLIQAGIVGVSILGGLQLWRSKAFRGVSIVIWLIALGSIVNLLEETGVTRHIYLVSPVFIMLFGPAIYLSVKYLIHKTIQPLEWLHILPVVVALSFTHHVKAVIAIGTLWRIGYSLFTVQKLLEFKRYLDEAHSDSDDYSLRWFVWLVVVMTVTTVIDLTRLNMQHALSLEVNLIGQGFQNLVIFGCVIVITLAFSTFDYFPSQQAQLASHQIDNSNSTNEQNDYQAIFEELEKLITKQQWYLKPRVSLLELSEFTGLPTRDISRAINLTAKQSFNEYINRFRVDHVCQLIQRHPKRSITDVFHEAGFSSKATFNKVFKEYTGSTPTEFKSNYNV